MSDTVWIVIAVDSALLLASIGTRAWVFWDVFGDDHIREEVKEGNGDEKDEVFAEHLDESVAVYVYGSENCGKTKTHWKISEPRPIDLSCSALNGNNTVLPDQAGELENVGSTSHLEC